MTFSSARAPCVLPARWSCPPTGENPGSQRTHPGLQRACGQHLGHYPEDVEEDKPEVRAQLKELARLLEMPLPTLLSKMDEDDRTFMWVKRQLDWEVGAKIMALGINGITCARNTSASTPEGEASAHVVGFTNVEDHGQEGMELAFDKQSRAKRVRAGSSKTAWAGGGGRAMRCRPSMAKTRSFPSIPKCSFLPPKLRDTVQQHKAKAGSVVVLDARTGELLALANYPSYDPAGART